MGAIRGQCAKHYEPELIYYVKDKCGLGRLRDTIKKRALKCSDNIYANWEKCAAYMLQVLNDFCIYRNILKEAREGLPYRYTGLRA